LYAQEEVKPYDGSASKREQVEKMFDKIAHSYDTLNHTLSLGIDRIWRRRAIKDLKQTAKIQPKRILDVATGTGDFAILAQQQLHPERVVGIDISEGMMTIGREKVEQKGLSDMISFQYEDCESMSFQDNQFDAIISAFALRNFQNLDKCLMEMKRVLVPQGKLVAIDLCTPVSFPMKQLFWVYKKVVMPLIGRFISHDQHAYTYLPETMDAVPQADKMVEIFQKAGLRNVSYKRLIFGMCILYSAEK
jgi:demethylmenaquinone methyltransferase/2-methoxy-6-polyprenyl-1,4-benzoquinol methylase